MATETNTKLASARRIHAAISPIKRGANVIDLSEAARQVSL